MMNIDDDSLDESGLESKEPTVAAYGFGSEYLGNRGELVVWDDLVTLGYESSLFFRGEKRGD
mgnify:CR=1 FL=1